MDSRRKWVGLGVALLILLAVAAASFLLPRAGVTEAPPCQACSGVYAFAASVIPTITPCDLLRAPGRYDGQVVRVRAIWRHDRGNVFLLDQAAACEAGPPVRASLPESPAACGGALKMLVIHTGLGFERGYNGRANVIVAGRYGRVPPDEGPGGERGLTILCVERVTPIGSEIRGRVRYAFEEFSRRIGI